MCLGLYSASTHATLLRGGGCDLRLCEWTDVIAGPTPWDVESDISILFCQHSVEEVRKMEQKTRLDIERKKEDLRQMVG